MIEVNGIYKLKKLKGLPYNYTGNCKVLDIFDTHIGKVAHYETDDGQRYICMLDQLVDPENPQEYSDLVIKKLESVMKPMNLSFWKHLTEDAMASTAAAVPALSGNGTSGATGMSALGTTPTTGCRVNGIPVDGRSIKKKKKKKNETLIDLTLDDLIEQVEDTFNPNDILVTEIKNNREHIRVQVGYTNPEANTLTHTINLLFLDEAGNVLDDIQEEDLTLQDCIDLLQELSYNHDQLQPVTEEFHEEYEQITQLIAQQLDRMNFEFANTEDIIYKKEGKYKYLLKFDNKDGYLKFKVSQEDNTIYENEWKLEEGQDITPIFKEIEDVYEKYGI